MENTIIKVYLSQSIKKKKKEKIAYKQENVITFLVTQNAKKC